jgi:hypothetical protein
MAPDACALVHASDVRGVLGGHVDDGTLTRAPDGSETICEWIVTTRRGSYGVQLDVHAARTANDFRDQRRVARGSTRAVRRLGDGAFSERAVVAGHVFDDLWVRVGTVAFRVEALRDLGPAPLIRLARVVVTRLRAG